MAIIAIARMGELANRRVAPSGVIDIRRKRHNRTNVRIHGRSSRGPTPITYSPPPPLPAAIKRQYWRVGECQTLHSLGDALVIRSKVKPIVDRVGAHHHHRRDSMQQSAGK